MADIPSGEGDPPLRSSNVVRLSTHQLRESAHPDIPLQETIEQVTAGPTPIVPRDTNGKSHVQHALQAVLIAMAFNLVIAGSKLFVAVAVTRSAALFSEGLHSTADAFNSITLLFGIIQGKKAPDRTHPFGYGLETNFWALMASLILFISALVSLWMGWQRLLEPEPLTQIGWAIGLLVLSVLFEIGALSSASQAVLSEIGLSAKNPWSLFRLAWKNIKKIQSPTTRFVFFEDLLALIGALLALIALGGGFLAERAGWLSPQSVHIPDALASIVIGLMLMGLSISLFRYNRTFLTGAAASESVEKAIHRVVKTTEGISSLVDLRTIDQGMSGLFIHLKVRVDPDIPVRDVDDLIDRAKRRLVENLRNVKEVFVEVLADDSDEAWSVKFDELVQEGLKQEVIKPREVAILRNVLSFTEYTAYDVMIPRTDVVSVEETLSLGEVAKIVVDSRHSRLPVYREHVDRLVGVVHARDVFAHLLKGDADQPLAPLVKEIDIYPENKSASDLLEEFRRDTIQMVAVLDEHGGFAGIVTAADLMGELVGDLWDDEVDGPRELEVEPQADGTLLMSGKVDIDDLNERFGLSIPDDEFKTIGGFVFGLLGREPEEQDQVVFEDLQFIVQEMDGPRIKSMILVSSAGPLVDGEALQPDTADDFA